VDLLYRCDNGITYHPVFDHETTSSIGDIAVAPSDPDIVWVGTGRFTFAGDGIFKSTDGGATWKNMGLRDTHRILRVAVHPQNPDIVYVAAVGPFYSKSSARGLYKTVDGGRLWTKVLNVIHEGRPMSVSDVVLDPENPDILYAATWDRPLGDVRAFKTAGLPVPDGRGSGIHKSTDGGITWKRLGKGLPDTGLDRISLDIFPKDPRILYASLIVMNPESNQNRNWLYRSNNGGETWIRTHAEDDVRLDARFFFHTVRVDPNDADHVYVLTTGSHESHDGGKTWKRAFEYGGDNCELWIDPANSRHMILAYDYGMAVSFSDGKTWYHPDDLPLAQLYAIGVDMDYPYNVYGGMQDFGTWKGPSTKKGRFPIRFEDWEHLIGGDGFYCQIDPTTSQWSYFESQYGGITRLDQKTGNRRRIKYRSKEVRYNWNAPILISPHNHNVIYHGAHVLLRSSYKGENWEEIRPDLSKNDPSLRRHRREHNSITTISESPVQQGVIWVGTDDGNVQLTRDNGKSWVLLNDNIPGYPGHWVSRVTASHHDSGTAYVTFTGEKRDDFRPFVYRTTDYGAHWQPIMNNLPNECVNVIVEDLKNPDLLFVGTNLGLYVSLDGGKDWHAMKNNMPTVPVRDLVIHPRENDLVVGTFGRGFFIADITPLQEMTKSVLNSKAHLFDIERKIQWVIPYQNTVSAQNFAGENEPHGVIINYYLKRKISVGVTIRIYDGARLLNELHGPGNAGLNRVEWGMTWRARKRTPEEIAEYDQEVATGEREPFYDYYDIVDYYGSPDEEVGKSGLSLRTRVAGEPGLRGREYELKRVQPGTYTIKVIVDNKTLTGKSVIQCDHWYDQ